MAKTIRELFVIAGVENAELVGKCESLLSIAESENTGIPKSRFNQKVGECNDLRADKVELEGKLETANNKIETQKAEIERLTGVETKFNEYKTIEDSKELAKWKEREKILNVPDTDPTYDDMQRIIGKFAIGQDITSEQARTNNNLFDVYEDAQYFENDDKKYPDGKKPKGVKLSKLNPFDLKDGVQGAFRDMGEAIRISKDDPALAKKLMQEATDFKE